MTAAVIFAVLVVILSSASGVAIAVISRQSAADALRLVETITERYAQEQSQLLDRFQAIRWEDLAAMRSMEEPDQYGGQMLPGEVDEEEEISQTTPHPWGPLRVEPTATDDSALLDEDFPRPERTG